MDEKKEGGCEIVAMWNPFPVASNSNGKKSLQPRESVDDSNAPTPGSVIVPSCHPFPWSS